MLKRSAQESLNNKLLILFLVTLGIVVIFVIPNKWIFENNSVVQKSIESKFAGILNKSVQKTKNAPSPTSSPTPSPTPKPLTFAEMNALYGPCVNLPVFYYHHIQSRASAVADGQTALTVYTDIFTSQMQYLKSKGYNVISMQDLVNFFDAGIPIAPNSIILTFDDGYQDFYTDAYPILSSLGFKATMFTATGLVNNPDYLTWDEISSMNNGLIEFANHSWSHKSLPASTNVAQKSEILTADLQLAEHGLNSPKVFAYPYGGYTSYAETQINSLGYQLGFGTVPGTIECKKQRFFLPRLRIGDVQLSYYGF